MKITSLVDNISCSGYETEHGLSLHIALDSGAKILFDTGQGELFLRNAECLGTDISDIDIVVISHGHYDHGGGLNAFLRENSKAKVHIRESAFERHSSIKEYGLKDIGIDCEQRERLVFCGERESLPYGITLFSSPPRVFPEPPGNSLLLGPYSGQDDFSHEQSMIIREGSKAVLFGGCAHRGIVNILSAAQELTGASITHVLSGMHIAAGNPSDDYISQLSDALLSFPGVQYYTMHCTGEEGFRRLKDRMGERIEYLSCGESYDCN